MQKSAIFYRVPGYYVAGDACAADTVAPSAMAHVIVCLLCYAHAADTVAPAATAKNSYIVYDTVACVCMYLYVYVNI